MWDYCFIFAAPVKTFGPGIMYNIEYSCWYQKYSSSCSSSYKGKKKSRVGGELSRGRAFHFNVKEDDISPQSTWRQNEVRDSSDLYLSALTQLLNVPFTIVSHHFIYPEPQLGETKSVCTFQTLWQMRVMLKLCDIKVFTLEWWRRTWTLLGRRFGAGHMGSTSPTCPGSGTETPPQSKRIRVIVNIS